MHTDNQNSKSFIDKLHKEHTLTKEEWITLIDGRTPELSEYLFSLARKERHRYYGHDVYVRGLIEFTNYCKNDCLYCGIRKSNGNAHRYRLSEEDILNCCKEGYDLGFRTFVLQGGEDGYYTDERIIHLIRMIKEQYPDCAITLSIGEKSKESYKRYFDAGADRYLLRHETADEAHYKKLHPEEMSLAHRKQCLWDLKEIGYQVGCGFMVGSPYQTSECLAEDLKFIEEFSPHMCGIGPFISQKDTEFKDQPSGTMEQTVYLLSLIRLIKNNILLPATTALGTIHPLGREMGIKAGANVVMPNLSPVSERKKYALYDNKICTGDESAQCKQCLSGRMASMGYKIVTDPGDMKSL